MDNPYTHVIEYRLYWFINISCFILKDILDLSIFVPGGSKERKNGALKVMDDYFNVFLCFSCAR